MVDLNSLVQLIILFIVILDPLLSFSLFTSYTKKMNKKTRKNCAYLAIGTAAILCFAVLVLGNNLLNLLSTNLNDFRVAGGIILGLLGIEMVMGINFRSNNEEKSFDEKCAKATATIIGTPVIAGPAAITTIIIASNDYGFLTTGLSVAIVLAIIGSLFLFSGKVKKIVGKTAMHVASTMMGLVTIAWAVNFIRIGLGI